MILDIFKDVIFELRYTICLEVAFFICLTLYGLVVKHYADRN